MIKAPFPWFGGKSRVADLVWERFGDCPNYVEPFAGSLAVLLARPHAPHIETVNDKDCYLANFWRALQHDADAVATWADWPVNEIDLHARHRWLLQQTDFRDRMLTDPDFYDAKIAGWWVWGLCAWIGDGWCTAEVRQLPHLGDAGLGLHRGSLTDPVGYLRKLQTRLRRVRVACGDWSRITTPSVTHKVITPTAVFLDPPYNTKESLYTASNAVAHEVVAWAIANGEHPGLRIALCGYEGDYAMPDSWVCVEWKANGGYANQRKKGKNTNNTQERIYFSPACLEPQRQLDLFGGAA